MASWARTEMYPGPEDLWVADERGCYASEFLVQMSGPVARPLVTNAPV